MCVFLVLFRGLLDTLMESMDASVEHAQKTEQVAATGDEGERPDVPGSGQTARILTLLSFLTSQPCVKAPLMHLFHAK